MQPQYLRKLEILSQLTETELRKLIDAPENGIEDYTAKEIICHEIFANIVANKLPKTIGD